MPRQIHVTITKTQQEACMRIAANRPDKPTWQEIARQMLDSGLNHAGPNREHGDSPFIWLGHKNGGLKS